MNKPADIGFNERLVVASAIVAGSIFLALNMKSSGGVVIKPPPGGPPPPPPGGRTITISGMSFVPFSPTQVRLYCGFTDYTDGQVDMFLNSNYLGSAFPDQASKSVNILTDKAFFFATLNVFYVDLFDNTHQTLIARSGDFVFDLPAGF